MPPYPRCGASGTGAYAALPLAAVDSFGGGGGSGGGSPLGSGGGSPLGSGGWKSRAWLGAGVGSSSTTATSSACPASSRP